MNFERFTWLLRREWMQHHRGWLLLALIPIGLALVLVPFSAIDFEGAPVPEAPLLGLLAASACIYGVMALVAATVVFQAAGIARRDQQDRSIEFWLSLPTGHWQSVLATLLMHMVLMPLMAMLIAFVGAQLLAMAVVVKLSGVGALGELLQPAWFGYNAAVLLRHVIGVGVAALWMSPVVLAAMAAASWLKGWGVPALVAGTVLVGVLVKQYTGHPIVSDTLTHWFTETLAALMPLARGEAEAAVKDAIRAGSGLDGFAAWMWADTGVMLRDLATPALAAALVVAAIGFALVVLRRAGGLSARLPWAPRSA
jgi:ABC-2 type transport system permease protein